MSTSLGDYKDIHGDNSIEYCTDNPSERCLSSLYLPNQTVDELFLEPEVTKFWCIYDGWLYLRELLFAHGITTEKGKRSKINEDST